MAAEPRPPPAAREAGTRDCGYRPVQGPRQFQGPAPWEPQHPAQVRQALLSPGPEAWIKGLDLGLRQGLAGFRREGASWERKLWVGGQGLWEEL